MKKLTKKRAINRSETKSTKKTTAKTVAKKPVAKSTGKKPTAKNKKTTTTTRAKKQGIILRKSGLDKNGNQKYTAVNVYDKIPNGWQETKGALTAPIGYKWINNGKSLLSGKRKSAFVKDKM